MWIRFFNLMRRSFVLMLGLGMAQAEAIYFHSDHLGSTAVGTNSTGAVRQVEGYTPFGEILTPHPNPLPFGERAKGEGASYLYTNQELDRTTELYYYGARYYDTGLVRFVSVDPVFDSPSPYAYVRNSPIRLIDPDGRQMRAGLVPPGGGPPRFAEYFNVGDNGPVYKNVFFSIDEIAEFEPLHAVSEEIVARKQCHICNVFSGATSPSDELLSQHLAAATPRQIPPGVAMDSNGKYVVVGGGHHRLVALVREGLTMESVEEGFLTAAQQAHLRQSRVKIRVYSFVPELLEEGTAALRATRLAFAQERGPVPLTIGAAAIGGRKLAGPVSQFAWVGFTAYSSYRAYQENMGSVEERSLGVAGAALEASGVGAFFEAAGVEWRQLIGSLCQLKGDCGVR